MTYGCSVGVSADSVINESMRLASGVFMVRYVTEDTWFETTNEKKFLVRAGDRVAIYPPAVHKDPEIFEDPQVNTSILYFIAPSSLEDAFYLFICVIKP